MKKNLKDKKSLNIAMLGHKRIPSREGGIEIVVEELATRMVTLGHKVTCYNRSGHHVSGKDFDGGKRKAYKGVRLKSVLTLDKKGLAAMTASVSGAICAAFGKYDVVHFHGQFTTESIENFMLFVPFSILLLWAFQKELLDESENIRFGKTVWEATKVVAVFSFLIEFTQLLFHLGTFQISDLTYNTLGGAVGGVIYYLGYSRKRKK